MWRDESLDPALTTWVVAPAQQSLWDEVIGRGEDGASALAIGTWLRAQRVDVRRASTLTSIAEASVRAWAAGQPHGTRWTPAAQEQASRPVIAHWRAQRLVGREVVDVTAGCGADSLAIAEVGADLLAADLDPARIPLLRHNLPAEVGVIRADALAPAWRTRTLVADPGRRAGGRRLRRLAELLPAVPDLLAATEDAAIVLPPALDLADPDLPLDAELEFVSDNGALVEATLWTGTLATGLRRSSDARLGVTVVGNPDDQRLPVTGVPDVGEWLVEPAAALVRARLVAVVGESRGWTRLDDRRALLRAPAHDATPWAHQAKVCAVAGNRPAALRAAIEDLQPGSVEFVTHGLDIDLARLRRELGNPPTGPHGLRVHLIRTTDGATAVITGPRES